MFINQIIEWGRRAPVLFIFPVVCLAVLPLRPVSAQTDSGIYLQKMRTVHTAQEFARTTGNKVEIRRSATTGEFLPRDRMLPFNEITVFSPETADIVWFGGPRGAARYHRISGRVEYFSGLRWLPDDRVTGIGIEIPERVVWIETPKGYSRIEYKPMTLAEKSRAFVSRIRARHVRWGLTSDSHLRAAGDTESNQMVSSDNDGLWTAMYVAAECFRFKVTGEKDALENARQGMQAIMRLEQISGISGFPARSFIKIGVDPQPQDGEWHTTPDGQWRWKADTSSDEIVGHYFVYPIYYDLIANEDEKKTIREIIGRITDHILDNNYQLIDTDGKRTLWGWWGPEAIWDDPDETGLRALHILSHLRVAHYLTGNARYERASRDLIDRHRYHLLTRNQKIMVPGHINHSDDELAFLSYYPLLQYERDAALREVYRQSLERSWLIERPERNPLWNFIYAAGSGSSEFDLEPSVRTLREIPMEQIEWSVVNSNRLDVIIDPLADRQGRKQIFTVLPYDELPMSKWNGNPYRPDGGTGGRREDDGAYFLLPYWMGRYHRLIGE